MTGALNHLKDTLVQYNTVDSSFYQKFDVKRGLRNRDGSGVLAGLTGISSVVGFHKIEGDLVPVEGILKYRGVNIAELMGQYGPNDRFIFERIAFLLLVGELPNEADFDIFKSLMADARQLPSGIIDHVIKGVPSTHIMNKLQTAVSALYAYDDDPDTMDPLDNFYKAVALIAKFPMIIAYSYLAAYKPGATFVEPRSDMSAAETLLYVLSEGQEPDEYEAHILDLCLVLHAEHGGGNNSTFTTYVVSSSASDIYSVIASAIASLKGPLHGAANAKVMEMMAAIRQEVADSSDHSAIRGCLQRILDKTFHDGAGKLYGLGHAVYTKSDPRAVVLKEHAVRLAESKGRMDDMQLYLNVADIGPELFQQAKGSDKVIAPNVDFFSGMVYTCLGIPEVVYTPLFAAARVVGWCAHRIEEGLSGKRIIRPGYKFVTRS